MVCNMNYQHWVYIFIHICIYLYTLYIYIYCVIHPQCSFCCVCSSWFGFMLAGAVKRGPGWGKGKLVLVLCCVLKVHWFLFVASLILGVSVLLSCFSCLLLWSTLFVSVTPWLWKAIGTGLPRHSAPPFLVSDSPLHGCSWLQSDPLCRLRVWNPLCFRSTCTLNYLI